MSSSLQPHGLYRPWNSPGQNTGVGSRSLLQRIFSTQGSNPGLPHCRRILYQLSHKGSPKNTGVGSLSLLQWVFLTQESNWGLLHCRWILYRLSCQGSPLQRHWISLPSPLSLIILIPVTSTAILLWLHYTNSAHIFSLNSHIPTRQ